MQPDVIIIGDSHTAALRDGCVVLGLNAGLLYISGNLWHAGIAEFHAGAGLHFARRPALQRRVADLRAVIGGGSLFGRHVPVIASFGYHLGRLVPPFTGWGHTADAAAFAADRPALFASHGLVAATVAHYRDTHIGILARAASLCELTVVAPPIVQADATAHAFACHITQRLQGAGVRVHDPRMGRAYDGVTLEERLLSADRVHGNAAYGAQVIGELLAQGLIRKPEVRVTFVA
jgi:hypothetical protein